MIESFGQAKQSETKKNPKEAAEMNVHSDCHLCAFISDSLRVCCVMFVCSCESSLRWLVNKTTHHDELQLLLLSFRSLPAN